MCEVIADVAFDVILLILLITVLAFVILCYTGADIAVGAWLLSVAKGTQDLFSPDALIPVTRMMVALGCLTILSFVILIVVQMKTTDSTQDLTCNVMLGIFAVLLLLVLVNTILAFIAKGRVEASMRAGLNGTISASYGYDEAATKTVDELQANFQCCGVNNYSDYTTCEFMKELNQAVPDSCCMDDSVCAAGQPGMPENVTNIFKKGCVNASLPDMERYYGIAAGMCLGLLSLQVLAVTIVFAVVKVMEMQSKKTCEKFCCSRGCV